MAGRLSRRRRLIGIMIVLAAIVLIVFDQLGWLLVPRSGDYAHYHGRLARVVRIIDGDTLDIAMADPQTGRTLTRVRLWGIDAPEIGRDGSANEPHARAALALVRDLAEDASVRLYLERSRTRGNYGRLLAHVELADGEMLNRRLLLEGAARADERWPHSRLMSYGSAELAARRAGRGLWE